MSLFQKSVLKKHLKGLDEKQVNEAWERFKNHFHNPFVQENIRASKEESHQGEFLIDLFVKVLGYTNHPHPNYNLVREQKNVKDSKTADGAIIKDGKVIAVIELKGTNTTDLGKIEAQAFGYKNNQPDAVYVITSNFEKLRFYIDNAADYEDFNLFELTKEEFQLFWLCISKDSIFQDIPKQTKNESLSAEEVITRKLYKDYSDFRRDVFADIVKNNSQYDKLILFNKTQKLLDRFLFLFFAEDRLLLPPNSIREIINQWTDLRDHFDEYQPLYNRFIKYFGYLNTGHKGKKHEIFAYNGGLFLPDEILDNIRIDDTLLYKHTLNLSEYDFESEVSVNILGHIFEHSLSEIEEIQAELEGQVVDKNKTKRKKDGVFYTPKYITKYIVDNTLGSLCKQKKTEFGIVEEEYEQERSGKQNKVKVKILQDKLEQYRNWLLGVTICDPACGSGAFLNQALEFLIVEHRYIDELQAKLFGDRFVLQNVENSILENNLFGVDINDESVEIAKLSLWLRTAQKGRKLTSLNNNIKCGNSLIDDKTVAGDKAFDWKKEFPDVFAKGGFDVIIGNPPYGAALTKVEKKFFETYYSTCEYSYDTYIFFFEKGLNLLKPAGLLGFITPNTFLVLENGFKIREFLFKKHKIRQFLEVFNVFSDAVVEPLLTIIEKNFPDETNIIISCLIPRKSNLFSIDFNSLDKIFFSQKDLLEKESLIFNYRANKTNRNLAKKIVQGSEPLSKYVKITAGIKPYEKGKGTPPQTDDIVQNKPFNGFKKIDQTWLPLIRGTQVKRYSLEWDGEYLKYGEWLAAPRQKDTFFNPKLFIRRTDDKLLTVFDDQSIVGLNSIHCLQSRSSEVDEIYFMVMLNSKLINWYFQFENFHMVGKPLAEVKIAFLERLPIRIDHKIDLRDMGRVMLKLQISLKEIESQFIDLLESRYKIGNSNSKLQKWSELDFKTFIYELKRSNTHLGLADESQWIKYFKEQKDKVQKIKYEVAQLDRHIDEVIYRIYELTPEEIKIIEAEN